jgi:hypothetical protein
LVFCNAGRPDGALVVSMLLTLECFSDQ